MNNLITKALLKKRVFQAGENKILILILILFSIAGCKPADAPVPYQYNVSPEFTWGFADFYGNYYSHYGIRNNVISLHLFTDKLKINDENKLDGTGQYLIIEDIFSAPSDTLLPAGTYQMSQTGEPYSFFAGKKFEDNREAIPSGTYMYYIESDPTKSKIVYVTDGTMNASASEDGVYDIRCSFILDGKTELKGTFRSVLPHFDRTVITPAGAARRKIILPVKF